MEIQHFSPKKETHLRLYNIANLEERDITKANARMESKDPDEAQQTIEKYIRNQQRQRVKIDRVNEIKKQINILDSDNTLGKISYTKVVESTKIPTNMDEEKRL